MIVMMNTETVNTGIELTPATLVTPQTQDAAPWVGVGTSGKWTNIDEAMNACGLDFVVKNYDAQFSYDEGGYTFYNTCPNVQINVRQDTHEALGCVSNTYKIVQNRDIFSMLEPFINMGAKITHGGMTSDGLCFMVADTGIINVGGDNYQVNVMATNSFNGKYPTTMICSPIRIICQNMYRSLMGNNKDNIVHYRHSLNVDSKLSAVKESLHLFANFKDDFNTKVDTLKSLPAAHSIEEFVEMLFPYPTVKELEAMSQRQINHREKVDDMRNNYINNYYNASTNSDHGTCFALVNAYYDYISHSIPTTRGEQDYRDKRFSQIMGGQAVNMKMIQYMCQSK